MGNGQGDYVGVVSGLLSQAEGSFPVVTGLGSSNAYSLQVNTNFFTTPACSGAANPSLCQGWQQFVFQSSGSVYMEYWLINWGKTCPSGWNEQTISGETDCWKNSNATGTNGRSISNLGYITLTGKASGGTDTVLMDYLGGGISAVGQDSVLDVEAGWSQAEFNVFGNGNGDEVNLGANEALVVQLNLTNGTTNKPTYITGSFTGETNNLTLIGTAPCLYGGTTPMIQFMESNASNATASCGASEIVTNIAQAPTNYVVSVGNCLGGCTSITYDLMLVDGTPGADIHMLITECGDSQVSASSPPGNFNFRDTQPGCTPQGTMYVTAPGYLTSSTNYMSF